MAAVTQAAMRYARTPVRKAVVAAAVLAVAALVLAGLMLLIAREGGSHHMIGAKPPPLSTTSMDDWTKSVCRPGSLQDGSIGTGLAHATGTGHHGRHLPGPTVVTSAASLRTFGPRVGGENP